jgi:hypothetical protein
MMAPSPCAVSRRSPPYQAWFWSPQWQAGEREAGREIAAGDPSPLYASAEDMFADLHQRA